MKINMGNSDRFIRMLIGFGLVILYLTNVIQGGLGTALLIVAGVLILTTLIGYCPLYTVLGINTCKKKLS